MPQRFTAGSGARGSSERAAAAGRAPLRSANESPSLKPHATPSDRGSEPWVCIWVYSYMYGYI